MAAKCSIFDCGKQYYAKSYCSAHYWRYRKHGDPQGGNTQRGAPLRFINEVAMKHSGDECLLWPYGKAKGYGHVKINGKVVSTHRYVCELAHGEPPTSEHEAAHNCGREGCIAPGHLEWKTHVDNVADTLIHGTRSRGDRNGKAKLTEADVREIIAIKGVESQRKIATRFGVTRGAINSIHRGKSWAWIEGEAA